MSAARAAGWFAVALFATTALVPRAAAEERILAYDTDVQVHADGSLDVTEHITVRAEGSNIRRGIYRDFPTRYRDRHGNRVVVGFEVLGVERDGRTEPWFTERRGNGVRVNTGNDDYLPVPGDYRYTLRYRTTRQVGFFDDHDELYWNAIGTGWMFPIDGGRTEVRLPTTVPVASMVAEGYTGAQGMQGRDFSASLPAPGVARWTLSRPLQPREGMTIVLSFPKGVVAEPDAWQRLRWLLGDNRGVLVALAGLVVLLLYAIRRWHAVGRDPAAGTIIVRYDPPAGHTPAGLRYMRRMKYDNRCFSADLLAAAVAGAVRITRAKRLLGSKWTLARDAGPDAVHSAEERALLQRLFAGGREALELDNSNAAIMQGAIKAHGDVLKGRFQPSMFQRHGGSIIIAAMITAATAFLAFIVGAGTGLVLILPVLLAMVAAVVVFAIAIKAPTPEGRRLLDDIEGFRRYLSVADRDDIARLPGPEGTGAPPPLDAGRYEQLLPFAVALEVEDAWTKKFTLAVGSAAAAAAASSISWYQGGGSSDLGSFASAIGNSLSSQVASASTPPGSSSGGGGGGSSGGGGGGGGGGGR